MVEFEGIVCEVIFFDFGAMLVGLKGLFWCKVGFGVSLFWVQGD